MTMFFLRQSLRGLVREPLFSVVAATTLALGIGANTAIFSVVHSVLLDPGTYPKSRPERVLHLSEKARHWDEIGISYPNFKDWERFQRSFETLAGYRDTSYILTGLEEASRLEVTQVSDTYFGLLGVSPRLGRLFDAADDEAGAPRTIVLGHRLWRSRFGADPGVVGEVVRLDDEPYTIIGVLPADFDLYTDERGFTALEPWADNESARMRGNHQGLLALARLRDGVSFEEAVAEMETIAARLQAQHPDTNTGIGVNVKTLRGRQVEDFASTLWALLGAVSLVLLVACANVANLLLARSVRRRRESAVQIALGASRWALLQRGLTEGMALALAGGALGVVLAFGVLHLFRGLLPADVPRLERIEIDGAVLLYGVLVSILTGLLFGAAPALLAGRASSSAPLEAGGRGIAAGGRGGRMFLVAEVALATLLLIGAGLLIRTVHALSRVDPGFRADRLLTFQLGVPSSRYEGEARRSLFRRLEEELEALPGVRAAALGLNLPMMGAGWSSIFIVGDRPIPERADLPSSLFTPVEPGYFDALEIPLLKGRLFDRRDGPDAPRVVVVNETLARHFWPDADPIGQRLKQGWPESEGESSPWREIVGVVGDVKQFGLGEAIRMQTYIPSGQNDLFDVQAALRTDAEPLALLRSVEEAVRSVDADIPIFDAGTMEGVIADSVASERFRMLLFGAFAGLALFLAAIGLYGVVAYTVARRTSEIGLRMSVGADRGDILRLVVGQGMTWALAGAGVGLVASLGLARLLRSFLYGVEPVDPATFLLVPLVLLAVALLACAVPAVTASRIDPIRALRYE